MRLRYLRVRKMPPLMDTEVVFRREEILGLAGAIHFVVGINGTGKSRMLQIVAETLLTLERGQLPPFPVTIAYDLDLPGGQQTRTICFHRPNRSRPKLKDLTLIEFKTIVPEDADWSLIEDGRGRFMPSALGMGIQGEWSGDNLPNLGPYLPEVLLAYTSGAIGGWEPLFAFNPVDNQEILVGLLSEATIENERPLRWRPKTSLTGFKTIATTSSATIGTWLRGEDYRLALLCAILRQAAIEFDSDLIDEKAERQFVRRRERARRDRRPLPERYDASIRSVLDEVGWLWPISITIRTTVTPDDPDWQLVAEAATTILREPVAEGEPRGRILHFDLRQRVNGQTTARRLLRALNLMRDAEAKLVDTIFSDVSLEAKPLAALRQMLFWQRQGSLRSSDVRIVLRKVGVASPLALESLSDGERMFLGRMALFYLLWDSDNALALLDEPETHFNDYWKREIIDILDKSLGDRSSDIVLTTHSSIALTDAFDREITLLRRDPESHENIVAKQALPPTFGAAPSEVLREIFAGPRTVGRRSAEFLDTILLLLAYPDEFEEYLSSDAPSLPDSLMQAAYEGVLKGNELGWTVEERQEAREQLRMRLTSTLEALKSYLEGLPQDDNPLLVRIVQALLAKIGAGYYRFEFSRRLEILRKKQEGQ